MILKEMNAIVTAYEKGFPNFIKPSVSILSEPSNY